jgi:tetratricopeptide (TPR) repeat protein
MHVVKHPGARAFVLGVVALGLPVAVARLAERSPKMADPAPAQQTATIVVDYPESGSIFPPEFAAPTFLWRDPVQSNSAWQIEVRFTDGAESIRVTTLGERNRVGEIDPRCISPTNELPKLTPEQAAQHTWRPDAQTWAAIKRRSVAGPAMFTIAGFQGQDSTKAASRGQVTLQTSKDPVGAPIFYRDVPLMSQETEKGVIQPLPPNALPLIAWRMRDVAESRSRLMVDRLPTCANCHSFSRDGKTLGMDLDGPKNDKGLYTMVALRPQTVIRLQDVIEWRSFRGKLGGKFRVAFMAQISPDGRFVAATINDPGPENRKFSADVQGKYYVANFKDYRFNQVFYPTRGVLAWYTKAAGKLQPLPGADDTRYVQTNGVWSPDGKYLVFARAEARDPYAEGRKLAEFANDPNETQIRYDLYRVPFNEGRGGQAEPIAGASANGMSNSFPKVSPDGRWIIFVQARNGLLMRPDSQLYIVPAEGGTARRLRCNALPMNSWHSWSPNGRWLVFSSKRRSFYTQMYLTHIDEDGNDSPAILIENATAANRAVNIPEFVNVRMQDFAKLEVPAAEFYGLCDRAAELTRKGEVGAAIETWNKALALDAADDKANFNLGTLLVETGKFADAIPHFERTLAADPGNPNAHDRLGEALAGTGQTDAAIAHFEQALQFDPGLAEAHNDLGNVLARTGKLDEALAHFQKVLETAPDNAPAHNNLGRVLADRGQMDEAIVHLERAVELRPDFAEAHNNLGLALVAKGRIEDAIAQFRQVEELNAGYPDVHYNLGRGLLETGRSNEALAELEKAVEANPKSAEAHSALGMLLMGLRRQDEAIAQFEMAVQANPDFAEAHFYLGAALYFVRGNSREALAHWRQVLRLEPDYLPALNQTAWVLATCPDAALRNGAEAVGLAEHAAQLTGGRQPTVLHTLAASYAEAGRFDEALQTAHRALDIATQQNNQRLVEALTACIAQYEARTPIRETPGAASAPGQR